MITKLIFILEQQKISLILQLDDNSEKVIEFIGEPEATRNDNYFYSAWETWKSKLREQNDEVDSLEFEFRERENVAFPVFPPLQPSKTVSVRTVRIAGSCNSLLTCSILNYLKPSIENLHIRQIGFSYNITTYFGNYEQIRTAKKLYCTVAMKKEQVLALEGNDVTIDPLYFNQCFVSVLIEKSLRTGNPKRFRVLRGGKNPRGVVSQFNAEIWTEEFAEKYGIRGNSEYNNYLIKMDGNERMVFLEFRNGRRDVFGCIID